MIAGFVVNGVGSKPILVRAVGPTLDGFGIQGTISDPELNVAILNGADIGLNDNWEDAANVVDETATASRVGAFALDVGAKDSAVLVKYDRWPVHSSNERRK